MLLASGIWIGRRKTKFQCARICKHGTKNFINTNCLAKSSSTITPVLANHIVIEVAVTTTRRNFKVGNFPREKPILNSILESSYAWPRRQREADLHFNLEEEEEVEPPRLLKEEWRYIKAIAAAAFRENLWVNTLWKCQIQTRGCRWKLLCPNQWCMQQKMADGRVSSDTDRLHKRVIETYVPFLNKKDQGLESADFEWQSFVWIWYF